MPNTLKFLQINNSNIDFQNIFFKTFDNMETLEILNKKNRKKVFDENEMKAVINTFKNLKHLKIQDNPLKDITLNYLLPQLNKLSRFI